MAELRVKSTGTIKLFENDNTSSVTIASPASLGADRTITLPDASVTLASGTMLATDGSGASLTALNASELGSGTVPTARLGSGTASSSTVLYGDQTYKAEPGGGISEVDQWRQATNTAIGSSGAFLTANWERNDSSGFGLLGTGLTESSGVFTFPSTGYWYIMWLASIIADADGSRHTRGSISVTLNDSSYTKVSQSNTNNFANAVDVHSKGLCTYLFDVTSTANCKFKLFVETGDNAGGNDCICWGSSTINWTEFTVMKMGDT